MITEGTGKRTALRWNILSRLKETFEFSYLADILIKKVTYPACLNKGICNESHTVLEALCSLGSADLPVPETQFSDNMNSLFSY